MTETELLVDCLRRLETSGIAYTDLFGQAAWIATAEDVLLHKLRWHTISPTERQLTDARGIVAVSGYALDRHYLHHWAKQIGVMDLLAPMFEELNR